MHRFSFLPSFILKLESETLSTEDQISIVKLILTRLKENDIYFNIFKQILLRNPDLEFFLNFDLLKREENNWDFAYVPLTTVEVERTFSKYRDILNRGSKIFPASGIPGKWILFGCENSRNINTILY